MLVLELLLRSLRHVQLEAPLIVQQTCQFAVGKRRLARLVLRDLVLKRLDLIAVVTITLRLGLGAKCGEHLTRERLSLTNVTGSDTKAMKHATRSLSGHFCFIRFESLS